LNMKSSSGAWTLVRFRSSRGQRGRARDKPRIAHAAATGERGPSGL
jgi:hypothetical protein